MTDIRTPGSHTSVQLDSLTGLRFLAAFVVFIGHWQLLLSDRLREATNWWAPQGYVGVSFFYLLSGFLLAFVWRPNDTARAFYRRRVARVYPNHVVTWTIVAGLSALSLWRSGEAANWLLGLFLLQAWVPDPGVYYAWNGVAWSLSCEAFFYLLFPLLIKPAMRLSWCSRRACMAALFLAIVVVAAVAQTQIPAAQYTGQQGAGGWLWLVYNCPLTRLAEFIIGMLLAAEVRDGRPWNIGLRPALMLAGVCYLLAGLYPTAFARVALCLPALALVICAAVARDQSGRPTVFAGGTWVTLGTWSYAFYLVHRLGINPVADRGHAIDNTAVATVSFPVVLGVAITLSMVLCRAVEHPLNRLIRGDRRDPAGPQGPARPAEN